MTSSRFKIYGLLTVTALLISACGGNRVGSSAAPVTGCILYPDQGGTINGRWLTTPTPVPIAFQSGTWNSNEISLMLNAISTWNTFFAQSMGYPAIDAGPGTPRYSSQALPTDQQTFCSTEMATNASFTSFNSNQPIVIYKDGYWPYTQQVIALTTSCKNSVASHEIPVFSNSYIEVNYQYFFDTSQVPDLQTILLHEFGHLMGLRHSCEHGSSEAGMPDCDSGSLSPLYYQAVMYPTFTFNAQGQGQQKRALQLDDEGRMNCTYQEL